MISIQHIAERKVSNGAATRGKITRAEQLVTGAPFVGKFSTGWKPVNGGESEQIQSIGPLSRLCDRARLP